MVWMTERVSSNLDEDTKNHNRCMGLCSSIPRATTGERRAIQVGLNLNFLPEGC
jgi:hypothetical protein